MLCNFVNVMFFPLGLASLILIIIIIIIIIIIMISKFHTNSLLRTVNWYNGKYWVVISYI